MPGVLAVGAHDGEGRPLLASNWGPQQRAQGLLAPGAGVPGACAGGGLCRASGTSFAAAVVSGVAGLLMSAEADNGLRPSGARVRKLLLSSATRPSQEGVLMAANQLSGRLDVSRALDRLLATPIVQRIGGRRETTTPRRANDFARHGPAIGSTAFE